MMVQSFSTKFSCEFHFAHVESSKAGDSIPFVEDCRGLALGMGEDDVDEVVAEGTTAMFLKLCSFIFLDENSPCNNIVKKRGMEKEG